MATKELCGRLAAAPDAAGEAAVLAEWMKLPPPQRAVRYTVRRRADKRPLAADEVPRGEVSGLEVVLHCADGGGEAAVVWRPKSAENLAALMRE